MDVMKSFLGLLLFVVSLLCLNSSVWAAEELYIITAKDGSTIVAQSYNFTDELVEFTTENGLQGFIKREDFVTISNMVGVLPGEAERIREQVSKEERTKNLWLSIAVALIALVVILLIYLSRRRKVDSREGTDILYGRKEKNPTTQGHLAFEYRGALGRISKWTVEVRSAYEEKGVLYIEGFCTTTGKRKKFSADRVVGPVTDMSSDHHAPMGHFFVDAKEKE